MIDQTSDAFIDRQGAFVLVFGWVVALLVTLT
jgi:hypothetical protein